MTEKRFTHNDNSLYIDNDYFCELEDGDEITELLNRQQYTVETVWKENEQLKKELEQDDLKNIKKANIKLFKENEQLKQQLFETSKELLWVTSDEVDKALYYEDEVKELRKEIFE